MWSFLASLVEPISDLLKRRSADRPREKILLGLLENLPPGKEWRTMETLSASIGADEAETTRLLLKIGARRSTGKENVWALQKDKPL